MGCAHSVFGLLVAVLRSPHLERKEAVHEILGLAERGFRVSGVEQTSRAGDIDMFTRWGKFGFERQALAT